MYLMKRKTISALGSMILIIIIIYLIAYIVSTPNFFYRSIVLFLLTCGFNLVLILNIFQKKYNSAKKISFEITYQKLFLLFLLAFTIYRGHNDFLPGKFSEFWLYYVSIILGIFLLIFYLFLKDKEEVL